MRQWCIKKKKVFDGVCVQWNGLLCEVPFLEVLWRRKRDWIWTTTLFWSSFKRGFVFVLFVWECACATCTVGTLHPLYYYSTLHYSGLWMPFFWTLKIKRLFKFSLIIYFKNSQVLMWAFCHYMHTHILKWREKEIYRCHKLIKCVWSSQCCTVSESDVCCVIVCRCQNWPLYFSHL